MLFAMNLEKAIGLVADKIDAWLAEGVKMLPNLLVAVVIIFVGLLVSRMVRNAAKKRFRTLFPTSTLADFAVSLLFVICFGLFIFLALKILHLDKAITTALGTAGIAGVALAFAFQDIASNFISGIFMSFSKPFNVGDTIKVKEFKGIVSEIKLRDSTILTGEGQFVTLPNRDIFQNPIVNFSRLGKQRLDIKTGISQADDLPKARRVALEALKGIEGVFEDETVFLYDGFGESSINFTINIWINTAENAISGEILNTAIMRLKVAFDQNGISLPYPVRTLDFGIRGGQSLEEITLKTKSIN